MSRIVMKFGGTSVGDVERIARVARLVAHEVKSGHEVAVVVSAMSGETNKLVALAESSGEGLSPEEFNDEYDVVVATGEQVTTGLLSLALRKLGIPARSWQGWQIPVESSDIHASARISNIDCPKLLAAMATGAVAVIPGFQGITEEKRITTLGRGGSDTSAVAVAAAINADRCDIYTDVDGVYTTDPRITSKAQRLSKISYEEMLEMASLGAKVLQTRSVELAMAKKVPVRVLSSFVEPGDNNNAGTIVCDEEEIVEKQIVSGIAYSRDEAKVSILGVEDHPGIAAKIFGALADANINVDMIVQAPSRTDGAVNMTFTIPEREADRSVEVINAIKEIAKFRDILVKKDVSKVSVIGVGMRSHVGVAKIMFEALSSKNINIENISTSEIKISVLIDSAYTELAVRALHTAYGLDAA
ncbi:MAG: aspartate kinase [Caulobacterales bacterium]|nr:aspartate kinase [Caulobacterales bacterium]